MRQTTTKFLPVLLIAFLVPMAIPNTRGLAVPCSRPQNTTEWLNEVGDSAVTVDWSPGEMTCSTLHTCFRQSETPDATIESQIRPIQIQLGVTLKFQSPSVSENITAFRPMKVTEEHFRSCHHDVSSAIIDTDLNGTIEVGKPYLTVGHNYFIADTGNGSYNICMSGLRLNVTVKDQRCHGDDSRALCDGNGHCTTSVNQVDYRCQCCDGYKGDNCQSKDPCSSSPCFNSALCVTDGHSDGFTCKCTVGFSGRLCENRTMGNLCETSQCENNGTCYINETHAACMCPPGLTGSVCQTNIDDCTPGLCVHGMCVDKLNDFQCYCLPGYYGKHCENEYNECLSNPCKNGGLCINQVDRYLCECGKGYTGQDCSVKIDMCIPNPCRNGTKCKDIGDEFSCLCGPGFVGTRCEFNINECASNPCKHQGTCKDGINGYECFCRGTFAGTHCEFTLDVFAPPMDSTTLSGKTHLHNLYVVAGTLCGAIFIVICVVAGCYCRVHETYKSLSWRRIRYKRQKNDPMVNRLAVSSVNKARPSIDAIMEATTICESDHISPCRDSLKPRRI